MDLDGLKSLWKVAVSPKVRDGQPRVEHGRMQIGKFGVGKLAAFALGARLTHVACVKNEVRIVSVGQSEIKEKSSGKPPTFDVYKTSLEKAKKLLEPSLVDLPKPWERQWPTWTLALIEEIDQAAVGRALKIGVLRQMVTSALPISAEFKVFLEKELVPLREISPEDVQVEVDVNDLKLREKVEEALQSHWKEVLEEEKIEDVPESLYKVKVESVPDPQNVKRNVNAIVIPRLGPVIGKATITKDALTTPKLEERGYANNGFSIYSHGKLVNPEDDLFGISPRSHRYWSKFRAEVEMPGLDKVLLVQRNQVSENAPESQVARVIMKTLFNFARAKAEEIEGEDKYQPESFGTRLRMLAPLLAAQALRGLAKDDFPKEGLDKLAIEFATLGKDASATRYEPKGAKILVNEDHPLIEALDDLGPDDKWMRRMMGEVVAGAEMSRGYLTIRGVDGTIIEDSGELIEVALRSAASFVKDQIEEAIEAIEDASHEGGKPFEDAIVTAFRGLRISARRIGGADEPDGILEIPKSGAQNLLISVEAKGSKGIITHQELSQATVDRQRQKQGCTKAIAVAREYAVSGRQGKDSALIREMQGKVPLITTDAIAQMLRLHRKRPFTYDKIEKILTTWTHPDKLVSFVETTWKEMPELGLMRLILTVAHEIIEKDATNKPDPGMIVADSRIRAKRIPKEQVRTILQSIQLTTQMIIIHEDEGFQFELLASPDVIIKALSMSPTEIGDEATSKGKKKP